jgi:hypothetical protein
MKNFLAGHLLTEKCEPVPNSATAFAGMTAVGWIPAFAGMTAVGWIPAPVPDSDPYCLFFSSKEKAYSFLLSTNSLRA